MVHTALTFGFAIGHTKKGGVNGGHYAASTAPCSALH
jgi:hypothetical protein